MGIQQSKDTAYYLKLIFDNYISKYIISKGGDRNRGGPEGSCFNSYYTEV